MSSFQGGASYEVFTPQGANPLAKWRVSGAKINKEFDKSVRSFVIVCEGAAGSKLQLPKDEKSTCMLCIFAII